MPGGHRRDALEREAREAPVVGDHLALALHDVDLEARLPVFLRRVRRLRRARDGRVAREHLVDDAAADLDAERQRDDVEQQHLVAPPLARQQVGLHGGAEGDHLVRIDVRERLLAEELRDVPPHGGHARGAADEDDAVELLGLEARVLERAPARRRPCARGAAR